MIKPALYSSASLAHQAHQACRGSPAETPGCLAENNESDSSSTAVDYLRETLNLLQ